jgi:hypothetical protein
MEKSFLLLQFESVSKATQSFFVFFFFFSLEKYEGKKPRLLKVLRNCRGSERGKTRWDLKERKKKKLKYHVGPSGMAVGL